MSDFEAITRHTDDDPDDVEWVNRADIRTSIEIVEPDPTWPDRFEELAARIQDALGHRAVAVDHVGSTSVPDLPAKPIIDIDLTVADPADEAAYVSELEHAGFVFRLRERNWHEHRLFVAGDPPTNLHVFGPASPEVVRNRMFRDWLREHPDDRAHYAEVKRASASSSNASGESMMDYNRRKEPVVREILDRAFRAHGML